MVNEFKDASNVKILYKNSKKEFILNLVIAASCLVCLITSAYYVADFLINCFLMRKINMNETNITLCFIGASVIAVVCLVGAYVFCRKIHNYRDIVINDNGILKYWLLPFVARKFVPFSSISAYYITEVDDDIDIDAHILPQKNNNDLRIVPIVADVGDIKGFSKQFRYGNELMVFTEQKEVITYFNIDSPQTVFEIISSHTSSINHKSSSSFTSNQDFIKQDARAAKDFIKIGNTYENIRSRNPVSGIGKDNILAFTAIFFMPTILYAIYEILCAFIGVEPPFTFKMLIYVQLGLAGIYLLVYILIKIQFRNYYKVKEIVLTTDTSLIVTNIYQEIKFSCLASEIEKCNFNKYNRFPAKNQKPDYRYAMEIITKSGKNYTVEEIYPEQVKRLVHALNILLLTAKGTFGERNK